MKALPKLLFLSAVLALAGCGKNNESGKSTSRSCIQYAANGSCSAYMTNISSGYSINGVSLDQVQMENPCILQNSYYGSTTSLVRQQISTRVNIGTVVANNDIYIGVTSFGDVAAIIGNGTSTPTFVAYLCPRATGGQGTLAPQITIGAYTNCRAKPITMANVYFPDGTQANFRDPRFGSSQSRPFSFCTGM